MKHTWIHWYIRDGHGNLRPLWHKMKSREDKSLERRWKGYRARREYLIVDGDRRESLILDGDRWGRSGERLPGRLEDDGDRRGRSGERLAGRLEEYGDREERDVRVARYDGNEGDSIFDDYGRLIPEGSADKKTKTFCSTLPENPYRVVMADYSSEPDIEFPDQPILQFWTWHTPLHLVPSENPGPTPGKGLRRYDIADEMGDWCGSLVLDEAWIAKSHRSKLDFIAISEAKAFTKDECDVWTYYIPKEREQSEWDLYYVLLVERKDDMKWERVALGKAFKAAFANAEWREIILG